MVTGIRKGGRVALKRKLEEREEEEDEEIEAEEEEEEEEAIEEEEESEVDEEMGGEVEGVEGEKEGLVIGFHSESAHAVGDGPVTIDLAQFRPPLLPPPALTPAESYSLPYSSSTFIATTAGFSSAHPHHSDSHGSSGSVSAPFPSSVTLIPTSTTVSVSVADG